MTNSNHDTRAHKRTQQWRIVLIRPSRNHVCGLPYFHTWNVLNFKTVDRVSRTEQMANNEGKAASSSVNFNRQHECYIHLLLEINISRNEYKSRVTDGAPWFGG